MLSIRPTSTSRQLKRRPLDTSSDSRSRQLVSDYAFCLKKKINWLKASALFPRRVSFSGFRLFDHPDTAFLLLYRLLQPGKLPKFRNHQAALVSLLMG